MNQIELVSERLGLAYEARKLINRSLKITVAADVPFPARLEMFLKIADAEIGFGVDSLLPVELAKSGIDIGRNDQAFLYSTLARFFSEHDKLVEAGAALELAEGVDGPWEANVYLAAAEARGRAGGDPEPLLSRAKQIAGRILTGSGRPYVSVDRRFDDLLGLAVTQHRLKISPVPQVREAIDYGKTKLFSAINIYPRAAAVLAESGQVEEALEAADKIPEWPGGEPSFRAEAFHKIASRQVLAGDFKGARQTALRSGKHDVVGFILAESAIGLASGGEQNPRPAIAGAIRQAEMVETSSFPWGYRLIPSELWATIGRAQYVNGIESQRSFELALEKADELSDPYERSMALVAIAEQTRLAGLDPLGLLSQANEVAKTVFIGPLEERASAERGFDWVSQQLLLFDIAKESVAGGGVQLAMEIADKLEEAPDKVEVMTDAAREIGKNGFSQQEISGLSPEDTEMLRQSDDGRVKEAMALFGLV